MYIGQLEFGDFVFGSVEIAKDGTFSMNFNEVEVLDEDLAYSLAVDYIDASSDHSKLEAVMQRDIPLSALASAIIDEEGITGVLDCSALDPGIDGYYFLDVCPGDQCDYRDRETCNGTFENLVDQDATNFLLDVLDEYGSQVIPDALVRQVVDACDKLPEKDSEETKNIISELLGVTPEISR